MDIGQHIMTENGKPKPISARVFNKLYKSVKGELFNIMRYDKECLTDEDYNKIGLLRSVIFKENKLVSFSPPKSMNYTKMSESMHLTQQIAIQELVEGTMINVFWNPCLDSNGDYIIENKDEKNVKGIKGEWEIATRSTIGGTVSYFQEEGALTFRRMFLEACNECNVDLDKLTISDEDGLYCYSFVLQHPNNRIVKLIESPMLYLIGVYKLNGMIVSQIELSKMKELHCLNKSKILFPEEFDNIEMTWERATKPCENMNMHYSKPGLVFVNLKTMERCKYRNKAYEEIKVLRGNEPKLQYHYLNLRRTGKVKKFLEYFPEKKKVLERHRILLHNFTKALYENYKSCYIKKDSPLKVYPKQYQPHMYNLHQKYIQDYRDNNGFIGMTVVVKYVNELEPSHLMYALNYNMRNRYINKKNSNLISVTEKKELHDKNKSNSDDSSDDNESLEQSNNNNNNNDTGL